MTATRVSRILLYLRVVFLAACVGMLLTSKYPPAEAQSAATTIQSMRDSQQDDQLTNLKERQKETDEALKSQAETIAKVEMELNHDDGIVKGFGLLLSLMSAGSLTLQLRKRT